MSLNILGVSALYHDSACCLIRDGRLIAAAEEERFTRLKFDAAMPVEAARWCLEEGGLTIDEIDCLAYYEDPEKKLARQLWSGVASAGDLADRLDPRRPEREIRGLLGYEGAIRFFDHHHSHAASSYYFSGFESAAVMTMDGVGEWATTSYGRGRGSRLELFEQVDFPDSLGLFYSAITSYLGFGVNSGEYKVMGLAPYGKPVFLARLRRMIRSGEGGSYRLDLRYFDFLRGERMWSPEMTRLLGFPPRAKGAPLRREHEDLARSLQVLLEELVLEKAAWLHRRTGEENLCLAGGVALNCVANGRLLREGPFKRLFVQPAAGDAGSALGAAAAAHAEIAGSWPRARLAHVFLGPGYGGAEIAALLRSTPLAVEDRRRDPAGLIRATARRLAGGGVVGWFQGRMEFGPRALGHRSILADPRDARMRDRINAMVKKREGFRPFAPVVLEERASAHFDIDHPSPFMLETCRVASPLNLPAITHADGSARLQTARAEDAPRLAGLLREFERLTGCPVLLNTSFNVKDEPIVCTPLDALRCFLTTEIDCLVLGDFVIDRRRNAAAIAALVRRLGDEGAPPPESEHAVYTFL